jgi:4-oxalocrotonate tautomerase
LRFATEALAQSKCRRPYPPQEVAVPLVNIRVPEGSLSQEKKERMIELVTDAVVEAEGYGDAVRPITWVIIDEVKDGSWGANGSAQRLEDIAKFVESGGFAKATAGSESA